jgi:hypothetical protein
VDFKPTVTTGVANQRVSSNKETVTAYVRSIHPGRSWSSDFGNRYPGRHDDHRRLERGRKCDDVGACKCHDSNDSITVSGWSLAYTLYNGLNLVLNVDCDPANDNTTGTGATGLYGVTGVVNSGVATLYVTNYPNDDLLQTYLYGITDTLATTTVTNPGTAFTVLDTAPAGSLFRGVSFVPVDSQWLGRDHERSVWPHHFDCGHRMRPWHNYGSAVGSLDAE